MLNIKTDSRKVQKGDTFVAIKGHTVDGHDYIQKAIENGATKIVCEKGDYSVETLVVESSQEWLNNYLKENFSQKINDLYLIGATGTNGKTTTCYLIYNALINMGKKAAYIGTIGFYMNGVKVKDLPNTTPEILEMYNLLYECKDNETDYVVVEASSHALALNRLFGIEFNVGIFTNLTRDHLDFHKTFTAYADTKSLLFKNLTKEKIAIINSDADYIDKMIFDRNNNVLYGFENANYEIVNYKTSLKDTFVEFKANNKVYSFNTSLPGKYNIYNLMACISTLKEIGFYMEEILPIVSSLSAPPGRMEKINFNGNSIIVDYAHTPDAMINVINTVKGSSEGKIYTLIGCTGDRDRTKRPIMAYIATQNSDFAIFTSDDPRNEDPNDILKEMIEGLKNDNYIVIPDREQAINYALGLLNSEDILLILGKGHETYQVIKNEKIPFSDKEIVLKYVKKQLNQ